MGEGGGRERLREEQGEGQEASFVTQSVRNSSIMASLLLVRTHHIAGFIIDKSLKSPGVFFYALRRCRPASAY